MSTGSLDSLEPPWAQLVAIDLETKESDDFIPIVGDEFTIGRGKDADLVIPGNKFMSTVHCVFVRGQGGQALLKDTSTNGTLLNGSRLERNAEIKLASEDIIRLVNRKDKPEFNIAFKFVYLTPPEDELDSTLTYDHSLIEEATLELQPTVDYVPDVMDACGVSAGGESGGVHAGGESGGVHAGGESSGVHAGGESSGVHAGVESGGVHAGGESSGVHAGVESGGVHAGGESGGVHAGGESSGVHAGGESGGVHAGGESGGVYTGGESSGTRKSGEDGVSGEGGEDGVSGEGGEDGVSGEGGEGVGCVAENNEGGSRRIEGAKKRQLEDPEGAPESKKLAADDKSLSTGEDVVAKPGLTREDSIAETLTCQICQEILHDCISLQPCMHSYCAGCYSGWMDTSNTCPACRNKVERINKNHMVNNLVDAYLRANPEKRRPEEDLKELDDKNKITKDMLYPKKRRRYHGEYDDDDDRSVDSSTDDEEDSFRSSTFFPSTVIHGFPLVPAPLYLCRQCPSYVPPPSTPPLTTPPPFTCSTSTNHVLCLCCLRPMPDRRDETDLSVPPQKCDVCGQAYCHMYWGCPDCRGCLNLFKDMDFNNSILSDILNNGNIYESRVLKEYMESKSLSIKDVLAACCAKLEAEEYVCPVSSMSPTTTTCYKCALRNFKELVYLFRKDIPTTDLPAAVTSRANCYWGKNCRTQVNKPLHAERFNHICEQTRH